MLFNYSYAQNVIKEYFLSSSHFIDNNQQLVLIVKEPQSELANEIGSRIYEDFDLIRQIQESLVVEIDTTEERIRDFCGFDLFLYLKSGRNLKRINQLNSNCVSELLSNKNIEFLKIGERLYLDTLSKEVLDTMNKSQIFSTDVIYADHGQLANFDNWLESLWNSSTFPFWYYDGYIELELKSNFELSVIENIHVFLKKKGINKVASASINWKLNYEHKKQLNIFEEYPKPRTETLKIKIYLMEEFYRLFEHYQVESLYNYQKKVPALIRYRKAK